MEEQNKLIKFVRPEIGCNLVQKILNKHYKLNCTNVKELDSCDDRNFKVVCSSLDTTGNVGPDKVSPCVYILKVVNQHESNNKVLHTKINELQLYLAEHGFWCSQTIPDKDNNLWQTMSISSAAQNGDQEMCLVKLMTYLEGVTLGEFGKTYRLQDLGILLAKFHTLLKDFPPEGLSVDPTNPWAMENMGLIPDYLTPNIKLSIIPAISKLSKSFEEQLKMTSIKGLSKGIIHGDFHDLNIIIKPEQQFNDSIDILHKYGIIDFNEISYSYTVLELGRLIADQMVSCVTKHLSTLAAEDDPTLVNEDGLYTITCTILRGYLSVRSLNSSDWKMLYLSIAATFCQYLVLGEHNKLTQPDNKFAAEAVDQSQILLQMWIKIEPTIFLDKVLNYLQVKSNEDENL